MYVVTGDNMDQARAENGVAGNGSTGSRSAFDLLAFFDGPVSAWGVFEDRSGRLRRRFTVDLDGQPAGESITVEETLRFDDGETERRVWLFKRHDGLRFSATGTGIVGRVEGMAAEGGARMRYRLEMRIKGRAVTVDLDDRYYSVDGQRLINRATVSKFGVRLGEVTIVFERDRAAAVGAALDGLDRVAA
jgi:hypothetical protein